MDRINEPGTEELGRPARPSASQAEGLRHQEPGMPRDTIGDRPLETGNGYAAIDQYATSWETARN